MTAKALRHILRRARRYQVIHPTSALWCWKWGGLQLTLRTRPVATLLVTTKDTSFYVHDAALIAQARDEARYEAPVVVFEWPGEATKIVTRYNYVVYQR